MVYKKLPDELKISRAGIISSSAVTSETEFPFDEELRICKEWLDKFARQQRSLNLKAHSYALKHRVERWSCHYISNGAFIQAAIESGFRFKRDTEKGIVKNGGLDAIFYMNILPEEEWKRIRPTFFSKWLFDQVERNNQVADLAIDSKMDKNWPRTANRFFDFWIYLKSQNVPSHVSETLDVAWKEYSGSEPPRPDKLSVLSRESFYDGGCDIVEFGDKYDKAPEGDTYIYVLFEVDGSGARKARYVGQTINPPVRLRQHILRPGTIEKVKWIGKLVYDENYPRMGIIEQVNVNESRKIEQMYMYAFADYERLPGEDITEVLLNKKIP